MVPYLDFLSVSNNFDCLIVNDAQTKGFKWVNPYLPSKLSDYRGSNAAIWALFEEGSELEKVIKQGAIEYHSTLGNSQTSKMELLKLLTNKEKLRGASYAI